MRQLLPLLVLCAGIACKGKKNAPTRPGPVKDTAVATPPADSSALRATTAGKTDIESFGPLKLGQPAADVLKILGEPGKKTKPVEWGADGLLHEDWTWTAEGLELNFSSEKENPAATRTLFSITASEPCSYKTKAGIGPGDNYAAIEGAYKKDINKEESSREQVTIGSVYGGIIFTLRNDKVIHVFLGAAAE